MLILWILICIVNIDSYNQYMVMNEAIYLTAKQVATTLGISLPTLYAYVSRGLIRS